MQLVWLLLVCSVGVTFGARGPQVIRFDSWVLEPSGEAKTVSYNNNAPPYLRHTIKVVSKPSSDNPDAKTAVKVTCKRLNVSPHVNGQCKLGFMVYDGSEIHKYCGEMENIEMTTKNDNIHLLFTSGPSGGGVVDCVAQAVYKD